MVVFAFCAVLGPQKGTSWVRLRASQFLRIRVEIGKLTRIWANLSFPHNTPDTSSACTAITPEETTALAFVVRDVVLEHDIEFVGASRTVLFKENDGIDGNLGHFDARSG